jgi:four helix bundle protein
MNTQPEQLRDRSEAFALRVIRLFRTLPCRTDTQVLGKQLLRCRTAVAANYRTACRSRSKVEFIARIGVVAEEADEVVSVARVVNRVRDYFRRQDGFAIGGGAGTGSYFHRISANCEEGSLSVMFRLQNY